MLLVVASIASAGVAGEHYVEIWNPPEARMLPSGNSKPKQNKAALALRQPSRPVGTRKVADPVAKTLANRAPHHVDEGPRKLMAPSAADLPRIVTPEGNVLRVNDRGTAVRVVR
jgi:hypothetical protein